MQIKKKLKCFVRKYVQFVNLRKKLREINSNFETLLLKSLIYILLIKKNQGIVLQTIPSSKTFF